MTGVPAACRELDPQIDHIADGDLTPGAGAAAHLAGCPRCKAQVALARRIASVMANADPPRPAAGFAARIERRLRRDWWQADQFIDVAFNLAVAAGLGAVAIGIWLMLELSGLTAVTSDASSMFVSGLRTAIESVPRRLTTYTLALVFIFTAIVVWWWVDNEPAG
jgi:anti-sigma factor RsiW